jgi:contractile injection system tube protein
MYQCGCGVKSARVPHLDNLAAGGLVDKLRIIGLEGGTSGVTVEAQFNPKEISVDKSVPWQNQKAQAPGDLEFSAAEPMTMACELMFDGFESGRSIQNEIDALHSLSDVDASLKRPPKVKVVWGAEGAPGTIPTFEAVIESVGIKYTMFDGNGRPLRATVRLGFKQARKLKVVRPR